MIFLKQLVVIVAVLSLTNALKAQPVVSRTKGTNTISDGRLWVDLTLYLPKVACAGSLNGGLDTVGAIVYSRCDSSIKYYCGGGYWITLARKGITAADNGLHSENGTIKLGGPLSDGSFRLWHQNNAYSPSGIYQEFFMGDSIGGSGIGEAFSYSMRYPGNLRQYFNVTPYQIQLGSELTNIYTSNGNYSKFEIYNGSNIITRQYAYGATYTLELAGGVYTMDAYLRATRLSNLNTGNYSVLVRSNANQEIQLASLNTTGGVTASSSSGALTIKVDTTGRNAGLPNYGRSIALSDSIAQKRITDSITNRFATLATQQTIPGGKYLTGPFRWQFLTDNADYDSPDTAYIRFDSAMGGSSQALLMGVGNEAGGRAGLRFSTNTGISTEEGFPLNVNGALVVNSNTIMFPSLSSAANPDTSFLSVASNGAISKVGKTAMPDKIGAATKEYVDNTINAFVQRGSWTPVLNDFSGYTASGWYIRQGATIVAHYRFDVPSTTTYSGAPNTSAFITGMPTFSGTVTETLYKGESTKWGFDGGTNWVNISNFLVSTSGTFLGAPEYFNGNPIQKSEIVPASGTSRFEGTYTYYLQ